MRRRDLRTDAQRDAELDAIIAEAEGHACGRCGTWWTVESNITRCPVCDDPEVTR